MSTLALPEPVPELQGLELTAMTKATLWPFPGTPSLHSLNLYQIRKYIMTNQYSDLVMLVLITSRYRHRPFLYATAGYKHSRGGPHRPQTNYLRNLPTNGRDHPDVRAAGIDGS